MTLRPFGPCLLFFLAFCSISPAQDTSSYSMRQNYSVAAEYSNDSSHIFLGQADNRRIAALDLDYSRRIHQFGSMDWTYDLELRPVAFIQNPFATFAYSESGESTVYYSTTYPVQLCRPEAVADPQSSIITTITCTTHWTYAAGASPLGQRFNFATHHRLQPYFAVNAGFLVATRDIPGIYTARFNFTFQFGAGLELFRDRRHAWTAEYHLQHLSNAAHGIANPGIDSQVFRLGYLFGK